MPERSDFEVVREALHFRPLEYQEMGQAAHAALTRLSERMEKMKAALRLAPTHPTPEGRAIIAAALADDAAEKR